MGMDSKRLSERSRQPGHDQTYRASEGNFSAFLRNVLNPDLFEVTDKPADLRKMLPPTSDDGNGMSYGVVPEVSITCKATKRKLYFEVKKQGPAGNADERACKHHTVQFQKRLREFTGFEYHSFITIMCESLATLPRYVTKHPYYFEPDNYFCWCDYSDTAALGAFLERVIRKTILDDQSALVFRA